VNGGFDGRASGTGAVFVQDQYASGWHVQDERPRAPDRTFGWSMRLPVGRSGALAVRQPSQTPRRLEMAFLAVAWLLALWVTRKSART
jgi:hypothetical protein